jgi:PAS domain S-box-containing protein
VRYALPFLSVALALPVTLQLHAQFPTPLFFLAILLTAWFGGTGPGLVAIALSTLALDYCFLDPKFDLSVTLQEIPHLLVFLIVAFLVCSWSAARRKAENDLRQARNELEAKVAERTAELSRSNEQLRTEILQRQRADEQRRELLTREQAFHLEAVAAQDRFRDLVNSIEGIVWEADADTLGYLFVSRQAERILGYPVERWLDDPMFWRDHIHPDDREWVLALCRAETAGKRDHQLEYRMIAADGRTVWLRDLATVVTEGDKATMVRGVMVDITALKQAEEERKAHLWSLESMDRVNRAMQGADDLETMLSDVLDTVLSIFECDRAWLVYPCDPSAPSWRPVMEHTRADFPGAFALGSDIPMAAEIAEVFEAVRASAGAVRFGPGAEHPLPAKLAAGSSIQSQIGMAIYPKADKPYMFGLHQCAYPRSWTPQEERLFQAVGRRMADALTGLLIFRDLRQSEAKLEEAQRLAQLGHWERDLETGRVTWSEETHRIFGRTIEQGPVPIEQYPELIHPEDRQRVVEVVSEANRTGQPYEVEFRVVWPNGDVRIVHGRGDVTSAEPGRPRRRFGTVQDITERRLAEEERRYNAQLIRTIIDNASSMLFVVDAAGIGTFVNPAMERITGFSAAELVGHDVHEKFHHTRPDGTSYPVSECPVIGAARSLASVQGEDFFVRKDGTFFPVRYSASPILRDGVPVGAVAEAQDITESRAAAEALRRAELELAHVTRVMLMGELTASIAHEVKQPLAAISANADAGLRWLARSPPDFGEAQACFDRIGYDGKRAGDVITRIRALVQKSPPAETRLDLNDTVQEVLVMIAPEARQHRILVRTDLATGLAPVRGDRVQLQQVMLNLAMNGIDAMKTVSDRPRELLIRSQPHAAGMALVAVQDSGIGVDPQGMERLFEPFYTTKPGGMGMGLRISRSIIEAHGGRLWAAPNPGPGMTAQFTLPVGGEGAA